MIQERVSGRVRIEAGKSFGNIQPELGDSAAARVAPASQAKPPQLRRDDQGEAEIEEALGPASAASPGLAQVRGGI